MCSEKGYNGFCSSTVGSDWKQCVGGYQKEAGVGISGTNDRRKNNYAVFPTGSFKDSNGVGTEKKHIFDVLGNVAEYTTEIAKSGNEVIRSSSTICSRSTDRATTRNGGLEQPDGWATTGFRIVLYVE